jgi:hypothetical protein
MFGRKRREIERWQRQRLLFRYWDGKAVRAIDPFRVYREVRADKSVDLETIGPLVARWEEPATSQLIDVICRVFGVARFDDKTDEGLTDPEMLNLFADLNDYLDYVKKKCNLGPTSQPSTV